MSPTSGSSAPRRRPSAASSRRRVEAEPGQRLAQAAAVRGGDRRAVEERALAGDRAERLADNRVVHHGQREVVVASARPEARCTPTRGRPRRGSSGFRPADRRSSAARWCRARRRPPRRARRRREGGAQTVDDQGLAGEVDVRHEVVGVRLDRVRGDARSLAHLQCACLAGEADGQVVRRTECPRAEPGAADARHPGTRIRSAPWRPAGPGCAARDPGGPSARPARPRAAAPPPRRRRSAAAACPPTPRPRTPARPRRAGSPRCADRRRRSAAR